MEIAAKDFGDKIRFFGRTLYDEKQDAVFFNWSCAGFTFTYTGTQVEIDVVAFEDQYPGEGQNLPWMAIFVDEEAEPRRIFSLAEGEGRYVLLHTETPQTHTLRVVKRSENSKGRAGLKRVLVEGEITHIPPEIGGKKIEFIGDSITCGFGGEMSADTAVFSTKEENGLESYAAIAADLLEAAYHCVCISGIPLCWAADKNYRIVLPEYPEYATSARTMTGYYEYADRFHEEAGGMTEGFTPWDFERFKPDAIVVNLGTNDAFRMRVSGNDPREEKHFKYQYIAFLHTLRRCNGPQAVIACTLGSMDYFLYDTIEKAMAEYKQDTRDERVFCMKFGAIDPWGEKIGGLGHPSAQTHLRMGHELARALKKWL